jgi:hypothetical protein
LISKISTNSFFLTEFLGELLPPKKSNSVVEFAFFPEKKDGF